MFLSDLTDAIYAAGYDFNTAQRARFLVMAEIPEVEDQIMGQVMNTAQADPIIPDDLAFSIMDDLSIPIEARA